ncbi:MAG: DUF2231 domain-containing protein [Pyrinomonadaceae bacterium]
MESKARAAGHAIHPMLIVFPLGLLGMAAIFDIIYLVTGTIGWTTVSFWMIAAGIISGLIAAVPGLIDWVAIVPPRSRAWYIGLYHGVGNVVIVLLFAVSWFLRKRPASGFAMAGAPDTIALVCSFAGFVLSLITGWLGGELIERLNIAVHEGANPDAPSSLSARPPVR